MNSDLSYAYHFIEREEWVVNDGHDPSVPNVDIIPIDFIWTHVLTFIYILTIKFTPF